MTFIRQAPCNPAGVLRGVAPQGQPHADAPAGHFSVDVDRVIHDLNRAFNPLHQESLLHYRLHGVRDGYAFLTFALPVEMTRAFTTLLESLHGFFRSVEFKTRCRISENKAFSPAEIFDAIERQEQFRVQACQIFDQFTAQGVEEKQAVKLTNRALKAKNHPWATFDAVQSVLRASGRFQKRR